MICPKCNKSINDDLSVCPFCFHNFSYTTNSEASMNKQNTRSTIEKVSKIFNVLKKIVLIGIVAIIAFFILFEFITDLIIFIL